MLSDTVGFVRDLPHHLVASFKATLEEATHADLLLIVLDVSHPHAQQQLISVRQVLLEIGCADHPALLLLNKADAVASPDDIAYWKSLFPEALPISAKEGAGIAEVTELVRDQMLGGTLHAEISALLSDPQGITFLEKFASVESRDYERQAGRVVLTVEISQRIMDQLYNQVRRPEVLSSQISRTAAPWRCRTEIVRELLNPRRLGIDPEAGPRDSGAITAA